VHDPPGTSEKLFTRNCNEFHTTAQQPASLTLLSSARGCIWSWNLNTKKTTF